MRTAQLRALVRTRFRGRSTPSGFPEHVVLNEVPVSQLQTVAERHGIDLTELPSDEDGWTDHMRATFRERWSRPAGVRRIDVVAMGLWRSTGHLVHGIELKVSRSDWLKELRQPEKAQAAIRTCDYWWLAIGDRAIVKDGELPDGWGLLVPHGRGLRAVTQPTRQDTPVRDPSWMASMVIAAATQHGVCRGIGHVDGYWEGFQAGRGYRA